MLTVQEESAVLQAAMLIAQKSWAEKAGTASGTPSTPYLHGPGGIFGVPGLANDVISTHVMPRGLLGELPAVGSNFYRDYFAYLTGFQATSGSNPSGVCDDPKTAGAIKGCVQTSQFGRYSFQTRELEVNRVGLLSSRAETQDLRLINMAEMGGLASPSSTQVGSFLSPRDEMKARMKEVGVAFERHLARQLWEGNPANNTDGYKEFPGLEILVGTTKVDAFSNTACPSLASVVANNNYRSVDTDPTANAGIITTMRGIAHYMMDKADRQGLSPVKWAWVMRPDLFYELTAIWACAYYTDRCATTPAGQAYIDATDTTNLRDQMRQNRYLLLDGMQWPVILDDSLTEDTNTTAGANVPSGSFASDIYLIPLTVRGGYLSTYMEYFNYNQGPMQAIADARADGEFWTDGGRFLWKRKTSVNWCVQLLAKIEPRVILLTPHLAARIQNVLYRPQLHTVDSQPSDAYWINGGVSTARSEPTVYHEWA